MVIVDIRTQAIEKQKGLIYLNANKPII